MSHRIEVTQRTTKRKGLGGLSPEKKKLLKQLIIQKAATDLRALKEKECEDRKAVIESRVPKLDINQLNDLPQKVTELYEIVCRLEEEKYDWELKMKKQDVEINELNLRVNDIKGRFVKPVLKKVSKTDQKFQVKFDVDRTKNKLQFLTTLKSTGQPKFALEDKDESAGASRRPDWSTKELQWKQSSKDCEADESKTSPQKLSTQATPKSDDGGNSSDDNDEDLDEEQDEEQEEREELEELEEHEREEEQGEKQEQGEELGQDVEEPEDEQDEDHEGVEDSENE